MSLEEFRAKLQEKLKENRESFEGTYKSEINELLGLSKDEIDSITPDITDLLVYSQLIEVVKEASRLNVSQAELKERITDLGDVAIKIAKKIPSIANLFI
jgi:hypothetical protein